jgi:LCP family protein required for cell wall assembly
MRDMYVPIPDKEDNRINAAYAKGGPSLAIKTINTNFGLDIRNYVTVDFFGLEKLIDKAGGVEINVSNAEASVLNSYMSELNRLNGDTEPGVKGGLQTLSGRQAVAYSRIRYVGNSDYERTERQRRVLNELFKRIKSQGVIKLPGVINTILPYVETSLSNAEILDLAMEAMKFNTNDIDQFRLPVNGMYTSQKIRGMAVLVPDIEQNKNKLLEFIYGAEYVNSIMEPGAVQDTKISENTEASGN